MPSIVVPMDARFRNLFARALADGAQQVQTGRGLVAATERVWRGPAGDCERPVTIENLAIRRGRRASYVLHIEVRCRMCEPCLRHRRNLWIARAMHEARSAYRNWMVTLTIRPEHHAYALMQARDRAFKAGRDLDQQDRAERFHAKAKVLGDEVTRYLKRVRKASGAKMRYILVCEEIPEFGKDGSPNLLAGEPHFHLLINQVDMTPITERTLRLKWKYGFAQAKLVDDDERAVYYVCKYLAKSALARVRASSSYGKTPERRSPVITTGA